MVTTRSGARCRCPLAESPPRSTARVSRGARRRRRLSSSSLNFNCRCSLMIRNHPNCSHHHAAAAAAAAPTKTRRRQQQQQQQTATQVHRQESLATGGRAMSRKKPPAPAPAPAVASNGCSALVSCLSLHRRASPQPSNGAPPRRNGDAAGGDAAATEERYWKRVRFLEEEIRRLSKWLAHEERPAPATAAEGAGSSATAGEEEGGGGAATECGKDSAMVGDEGDDPATASATAAKMRVSVGHGAGGAEEMARLEDGSYLREVRRVVGRPWKRLAVQVSRPVVPEDAATAAEVLDKMTSTSADHLCKFLTQKMPLKDVAGRQSPGEPVRRTRRLSSGDDLLEALILKSMDKIEALVLEGLKIQMSSTATSTATSTAAAAAAAAASTGGQQRHEAPGKDCMVVAVLMQARDPTERYGAIGDPMIGLIEASLGRKDDGKVRLQMQGLHVAGISFVNRRAGDGRCMMWSASLRRCKGLCNGGGSGGGGGGDGDRCNCVRNPNRAFKR
ncbi:hypothetical protein ACP4OV_025232 [Aristida adscensionis]